MKRIEKYEEDENHDYGCDYDTITYRHRGTTSWGPAGFKKDNHPLAIMVRLYR